MFAGDSGWQVPDGLRALQAELRAEQGQSAVQ